MFGGPFVDLPETSIASVRQYISDIQSRRAVALSFANAFRDLETQLHMRANGYSLDQFRRALPQPLRGRVDLVYTRHNDVDVRLFEELFFVDDMAHSHSQGVLLHKTSDKDRTFFLSTPRLDRSESLYINQPFSSQAVQAISASRDIPLRLDQLADDLRLDPIALQPFFSPQRTTTSAPATPYDDMRIRYFGHACILIETPAHSILVDPCFAYDRLDARHLTVDDLPKTIDTVLISHGHQDHFVPEALLQIRHKVGQVIIPPANRGEVSDPSLEYMLRTLGYHNIVSMTPLSDRELDGVKITSLPFSGEHCDLAVSSKHCALIERRDLRICILIDSDAIDIGAYEQIRSKISNPDILFLGMECLGAPLSWLYGPLSSTPTSRRNDLSRRLSGANADDAWRIIELVQPKRVAIYAMGQEPWMRSLMGLQYAADSFQLSQVSSLIARCRENNIIAEQLDGFGEFVF